MLPNTQSISSLLYLAVTYPIISLLYRNSKKTRKRALLISTFIVTVLFALKMVSI